MKKPSSLKWLVLVLCLSCCRGKTNIQNAKKITEGMTKNEVKSIMGKPDDSIQAYVDEDQFILIYSAPFASSDDVEIYFGKVDKKVKKVILPKGY